MQARRSAVCHTQLQAAVLTLLVSSCLIATAGTSETAATVHLNITALHSNDTNYNCPADCHCVLTQNTHKPFLHAKCTGLNGLKSMQELNASYPIHSIDLSYLRLARLSHVLEKLPDVTSINLSHNELHEIGHLGRRIKKLNLKHNRLTSAKLSKLPQHVQVLNLQHNDITYLPLDMTKLSNLQTLELSHNALNCSCETLEVRNWLQERRVFMEHPVKCSYPVEYKGKSWLQIKQDDVCAKEKRGWHPDDEENELMLGDQPVEGSADNEDEDEFGKAYIPIDKKASKSNEVQLSEVEGSGDLSETNVTLDLAQLTTQGPDNLMARVAQHHTSHEAEEEDMPVEAEEEEPEEDGSGSGGGMLFIPHLAHDAAVLDDFDADDDKHGDEHDSKPIEEPVESAQDVFNRHMHFLDMAHKPGSTTDEPASASEAPEQESAQDVFNRHMGIFEGAEAETDKSEQTAPAAVGDDDDDIWPVVHDGDDSDSVVDMTTEGALSADKEQIKQAKMGEQDDTNATYFLLGVIGIIVIGLLLYVGIKRCKQSNGTNDDVESPLQRELMDMDKKNPGKPLRNGNEHLPLIGEKSKADMAKPTNGSGKKPYDGNDIKDSPTQQEPLINGNNAKTDNAAGDNLPHINEPEQQQPHEYYPITPRYPTPQSPRASKYAQYPQGEQNNNNPDDTYLPSSPKSGRYSPVYSPETGRVKIKLTETPRPKTPMLVTRSKSNAGDIITTPVRADAMHMANGSGANGQLVH